MSVCQSKDIAGVEHCHAYPGTKPPDAVILHRARYPTDTHFWAVTDESPLVASFPAVTEYSTLS